MTTYRCQVVIDPGTPHARECREPATYLDAATDGVKYSGWRHVERERDADHWPVVDAYPRQEA